MNYLVRLLIMCTDNISVILLKSRTYLSCESHFYEVTAAAVLCEGMEMRVTPNHGLLEYDLRGGKGEGSDGVVTAQRNSNTITTPLKVLDAGSAGFQLHMRCSPQPRGV